MQNISENLMELNRTVCIEYPNQKIPWFHEKYCLEKRALGNYLYILFYFY